MERSLTLKLTVADVLATWPEVIPVFNAHRMACVGCTMARFETVEKAARIYKLDPNQFLIELNQAIHLTRVGAWEESCNLNSQFQK